MTTRTPDSYDTLDSYDPAAEPLVNTVMYTALAPEGITDQQLEAIVLQSRANNQRVGITGALFFRDGQYLQLLEGPVDAIDDLMVKILNDSRCSALVIIDQGLYPRIFDQWSMEWADLSRVCVHELMFGLVQIPWTVAELSKSPMKLRKLMIKYRHREHFKQYSYTRLKSSFDSD